MCGLLKAQILFIQRKLDLTLEGLRRHPTCPLECLHLQPQGSRATRRPPRLQGQESEGRTKQQDGGWAPPPWEGRQPGVPWLP